MNKTAIYRQGFEFIATHAREAPTLPIAKIDAYNQAVLAVLKAFDDLEKLTAELPAPIAPSEQAP